MNILRDALALVSLTVLTICLLLIIGLWIVAITVAYPFVLLFDKNKRAPSYKEMTIGTFESHKSKAKRNRTPASEATIIVDAPDFKEQSS